MLTEAEQTEAQRIAELEVRRYFDHYLEVVFPSQVQSMVKAHDTDAKAHGGVATRVSRASWLLVGASIVGGLGTGFGIEHLIKFLAAL